MSDKAHFVCPTCGHDSWMYRESYIKLLALGEILTCMECGEEVEVDVRSPYGTLWVYEDREI